MTDALHTHDHSHHHHGDATSEPARIGFEAFGVHVAVSAPAELLPRIETVLPPGCLRRDPEDGDHQLSVMPRRKSSYRVEDEAGSVSGSADVRVMLMILEARLRACVAFHAPAHIFVHAGVVGFGGRAIVIPGRSFSGKTTLVAELVKAGAVYYSDEYAVLGEDGLVHPYSKPLSIRLDNSGQTDFDVSALGGVAGDAPLPIGLVVAARFTPGADWQPRQLSGGESVLAMMANTVPAQDRPAQSLATIKRALNGAVVLEGERGDAAGLTHTLLDAVSLAAA